MFEPGPPDPRALRLVSCLDTVSGPNISGVLLGGDYPRSSNRMDNMGQHTAPVDEASNPDMGRIWACHIVVTLRLTWHSRQGRNILIFFTLAPGKRDNLSRRRLIYRCASVVPNRCCRDNNLRFYPGKDEMIPYDHRWTSEKPTFRMCANHDTDKVMACTLPNCIQSLWLILSRTG